MTSFDHLISGTHTFTVKVNQGIYLTHFISRTYTLIIIDPCDSTVFTLPTLSNELYNIADPTIVRTFAPFTNSPNICGTI